MQKFDMSIAKFEICFSLFEIYIDPWNLNFLDLWWDKFGGSDEMNNSESLPKKLREF